MESSIGNKAMVAKMVAGALVAMGLTVGAGLAMAMDLQDSFAPGREISLAPQQRRGIVLVESGAYLVPELARRERKGVVLVDSGADLVPAQPLTACAASQPSALLVECPQPADAPKHL
jgi:hypothetical protein